MVTFDMQSPHSNRSAGMISSELALWCDPYGSFWMLNSILDCHETSGPSILGLDSFFSSHILPLFCTLRTQNQFRLSSIPPNLLQCLYQNLVITNYTLQLSA